MPHIAPTSKRLITLSLIAIPLAAIGSSRAATEPRPEPTASYASLEAARDTIAATLRRIVSPANRAVRVRREPVAFAYHYAKAMARGWAFHVDVSDTTDCPYLAVEHALSAAGWAEDYDYSADGPDGSVMGYVCPQFLCVVDARWDGGDDTDSTYVPNPGCKVTITCVPRRMDDVAPN